MWGFSRETQKVSFSVLSKEDLKAIHWATLDVLERTGVKVYSDKCLKILEEAGCKVDYKDQTALIPSDVVEEALTGKKRAFRLYARNPKYDVKLDGRHIYITTDGNGTNTLDLENEQRRASTKDDIAKSATIADARAHLRKEQFIPDLTDRRSYEAWLRDGAKDIVKKAKEKVKTILEKHQPEPLEKDIQKEIQNIIKKAGKDLANI